MWSVRRYNPSRTSPSSVIVKYAASPAVVKALIKRKKEIIIKN